MSVIYTFGFSVAILIFMKGCYTIPLPGARSHVFYQNSDLSSLPKQESIFQDEIDFKPTFRNIIPNFSSKASLQVDSNTADSDKLISTETSLENLLDNLYGSNKWRSLLEHDGKEPEVSTTSLPLPEQTTPSISFKGFYSYEISGNKFNGSPPVFEKTTPMPTMTSQYLKNFRKFMMKIPGTRQHESTDAPKIDSQKPDVKATEWGAFPKDTGVSSMFFSGQTENNQQHLTMRPQLMSITQKPTINIDSSSGFNPNYANVDGGHLPQYVLNSGINNFNPNEINNKQNVFQPNSAFRAYITQTGSDPNNRKIPVDYDADAINERYIEQINSLYQGHIGQATEAVYGTQQYGYRFSAYGDTKPQAYNADALNRDMMESSRNMAQTQMNPMLLSGLKGQQATSNQHVSKVENDKEALAIHKNVNTPDVNLNTKLPPTTTAKSPLSFGFVPGNLFPGQSYSSTGQQQTGGEQESLPPQFLRHVPIATGKGSFNPDKINAAQNAYNPNKMSWVQSRDTEKLDKREVEDEADDDDINSTTMQTYTSTTTKQPIKDKDKSINMSSSNNKNSVAGANTGFDPNFLNSNQGQTDFIPGQIAPIFNGYIQTPYGSVQQSGKLQSGSMTKADGAQVTFDIARLLGIKAKVTDKNTSVSYVQGMMPLFNTISANNLMKGDGDSKNSSRNMADFYMGQLGSSFDPNVVNQGFSNILGSGGYGLSQENNSFNRSLPYTNGYAGFDPNAANVGFGNGGFGMGKSDTSGNGGYISAFDPNKVNQMSVKSPFKQMDNGTGNGGLTSYFLGILSGTNGQSQYSSAYLSAFNPDSVNVASYDPNKYNQVHLHFDPLSMLSGNPGIDNNTLVAAASAFNPDKINNPNMQQKLSPVGMMSSNAGVGGNTLSSNSSPYSINKNTSTSLSKGTIQPTGKSQTNTHQEQTGFDPVALMFKLMQTASAFQPGNVGIGNQNHDPSSMIGSNSIANVQSTTLPPVTQSRKSTTASWNVSTHSTPVGSLLSTVPTTSISATTNSSRNGIIG